MKINITNESIELLETIADLELVEHDINTIINVLIERYFEHVTCQPSTSSIDKLVDEMVQDWRQRIDDGTFIS